VVDANGLWRLSKDEMNSTRSMQNTTEVAANVYTLPLIKQAIRYLHAAAGFPTKDSWVKAITNGNYVTWPGLTVDIIKRHYPESVETQKGHLKKQRKMSGRLRRKKTKMFLSKTANSPEQSQNITFW
jgi:hypothetical protein